MDRLDHCAIDIATDCNYDWIIENLLNGNVLKDFVALPKGETVLYSHIAINKIIEEEVLHDQFAITTTNNSSLKSMSSGEQKKALLQYLINKKPACIVMDNVLDNLDIAAQENITATLKKIATDILIIQVINRRKDILPFIKKIIAVKKDTVSKQQTVDEYIEENSSGKINFPETIPSALQTYALPEGPLIKLENVSVSYNERPILNKINWAINAGEFWQIKGPNGSGKSTLLSLITGDNPKGYGQELFLFGMKKGNGEAVWDIKKNIGYLTPTMTQFFPRLDSVEKMVLSGFFDSVGLYTIPNETQTKTADNWLRIIGLFEDRNKPFCFLSLGKQRMVLVARAMVKHPPLLILDEPTSGLNDNDIIIFTALINKIAEESTTAILYVSHRAEAGLDPQHVFELIPSDEGSIGKIG